MGNVSKFSYTVRVADAAGRLGFENYDIPTLREARVVAEKRAGSLMWTEEDTVLLEGGKLVLAIRPLGNTVAGPWVGPVPFGAVGYWRGALKRQGEPIAVIFRVPLCAS
jgi:hypothetical protein